MTELRAGVVVGSGSLSFEMIRYLAERVPVMICPRWVFTRTQPIAIRNVLDYLVAALATPESAGQVIEIGGADVVTYGEMMTGYAAERGLRRWLLPVPVLTPRLSSFWVHLVTPIPAAIARPLIDGLKNEVVVRDTTARRLFPEIVPVGYREAVAPRPGEARRRRGRDQLERRARFEPGRPPGGAAREPRRDDPRAPRAARRRDRRSGSSRRCCSWAAAAAGSSWTGPGGCAAPSIAWWGASACGAAGAIRTSCGRATPSISGASRRWRRRPLLRLRAEMKVPGRAWLQFEVREADGQSVLAQTAFFAPKGLAGLLYWYALYPVHALIFSGLVRRLAARAEAD